MAKLTHKWDIETASILESWDVAIRNVAPQGSSLYILLLPHGRETLTAGSINARVAAAVSDHWTPRGRGRFVVGPCVIHRVGAVAEVPRVAHGVNTPLRVVSPAGMISPESLSEYQLPPPMTSFTEDLYGLKMETETGSMGALKDFRVSTADWHVRQIVWNSSEWLSSVSGMLSVETFEDFLPDADGIRIKLCGHGRIPSSGGAIWAGMGYQAGATVTGSAAALAPMI